MYYRGIKNNMNPNHINTNKIKPKQKKLAKLIPLKDISYYDFFNQLNKSHPIKLDEKILKKLYKQYPVIPMSDVALIMRSAIEVIREHMIQGYKINIKQIFNETHFTAHKIKTQKPFIKVKNRTSPYFKKVKS